MSTNIVHVVAVSSVERAEQARALYSIGMHAEIYASYDEVITANPERGIVLAEDIPDQGGIGALIERMSEKGFWLPVIAGARQPAAERIVSAIKAGAIDYLPLPFGEARLGEIVARASEEAETYARVQRQACEARLRLSRLTQRESEVLDLLVAGFSNKCIARDLEISPRTVEIHRAHMMSKLGASHAADAVRMRLEAGMAHLSLPPVRELGLKAA